MRVSRGRDAARREPGGENLEDVRVGFAEAVLEGPEAEVGLKQVHPQPVGCQRLLQFAQGVGLGVGGDAEQALAAP